MANDNQQSSAPLPSLTDSLEQAAQSHKGTDLGGLLQWAILHIQDQREAIEMKESEVAFLLCENRKMHAAIAAIMAKADDLSAMAYNAHPTRDYVGTVDTAPHINIMGGHYRDRNLRGKPRGSARGSSEQAGTACGATSVASGQLACEVQQGQPHQPLPTAMLSGE